MTQTESQFVPAESSPVRLVRDYLETLGALTFEVECGISALVSNSLSSFQEHLLRQELLCSQFGSLTTRMRNLRGTASVAVLDPKLSMEIRNARAELEFAMRKYHRVLQHSRQYIEMMMRLFGTENDLSNLLPASPNSLNLSCEV